MIGPALPAVEPQVADVLLDDGLHVEEATPVDVEGRPLRTFQAFGRRHVLYLVTGGSPHAVDLLALGRQASVAE